jgi:hypothetical protein
MIPDIEWTSLGVSAATLTPRPPFKARVEAVKTKPFFREPFTPADIDPVNATDGCTAHVRFCSKSDHSKA